MCRVVVNGERVVVCRDSDILVKRWLKKQAYDWTWICDCCQCG